MLTAVDIKKSYSGPHGKLEILKGVDLEIRRGQIVFIIGRSGAGKSTLLHILGGLDKATSGTVMFEDRKVGSFKERALTAYRNRNIGFVFQFYHLLPELTVTENVALPSLVRGQCDPKRARKLLERVGLAERQDHLPSELSGGEQQRAAIARALINEPDVVLCDEPTGNLDEETAESIHQLIFELNREGQTFCIVTHDETFAQKSHQLYRLHEGVVTEREGSI